jgi:hypothetical protein
VKLSFINRATLIISAFVLLESICIHDNLSQNIESYIPPVKVIESNSPEPGYFFISSRILNTDTALYFIAIVDNYGTAVYYRRVYLGNGGFRLQKNGYLTYRPNWTGFGYFVLDSSYNRIDTLYMLNCDANQHDFKISEDGHALFIGNYYRNVDMSKIVEGGNPDASVLELVIQEFDNMGMLVFEWRSWEHFEILEANDNAVSFTSSVIDYIHPNGIEFDSDTSILISSRYLDEITKIDRRTGEIIWRLGGKKNQFTFINDTIGFSQQHSITKLDNGNILLFDNGNYHTPRFSSAVEYTIDEDLMTATLVKRYRPYFDIYASFGCNAQKLQGGNILLGLGETKPSLIELRPDNSIALVMDFSDYASSLLITKNPWKTNLFSTNTDTIIFPKYEYTTYYYQLRINNNSDKSIDITGYSTHTSSFYIDNDFPFTIPAKSDTIISVAFKPVNEGYVTDILTINSDIVNETLIQRVARQVYLEGTSDDFNAPVVNISPSDEAGIPVDTKIYIEFNEPVRFADDSEIDYTNIKSLLTFKKTNAQGQDIEYIVSVSTDKKLITLIPLTVLEEEQVYYVSVANGLEDYSGNQADELSTSFVTGELQPPRIQFDPEDGSTGVPTLMQAIVSFSEPVRLLDNREIDNTNADSLITFKESSGKMNHVSFDASINAGKTEITVIPESELQPYTGYVIIVKDIEDYSNNTIDGNIAKLYFTTGASLNTLFSFPGAKDEYTVYPNPFKGEFIIDFGSIETRFIGIYDFTGTDVFHAISYGESYIVNTDKFSPGIYFIKINKLNSSEITLLKVINK